MSLTGETQKCSGELRGDPEMEDDF